MSTPLTQIRNIGPAMAADLQRAGIDSAEQLREIGPDAAYEAMLRAGTRPHFIAFYVLHMGLQGRPWNDCQGAEKTALRHRFDQIKAACFDPDKARIESLLDDLGVGAQR